MVREIAIDEYLSSGFPLIDVRSPGEFASGHIPFAVNIPLFTDEERARVGTVYTRESAEKALELGYRLVNPKLTDFLIQSGKISKEGRVAVHCWRGGMRSRAFAAHLSGNGFSDVCVITGGYKAFRNYVLRFFSVPFNLNIVGGYTGSGKTDILHYLQRSGHQAVDLEGVARHKGSSFGGLGQDQQPSQEQFENDLFEAMRSFDTNGIIWLEDESHNIGGVNVPSAVFLQMSKSRVFFLDVPKEIRAGYLVREYALYEKELIAEALRRISRRLGGQQYAVALQCLNEGRFYDLALLVLTYYDKKYRNGLKLHDPEGVITVHAGSTDPAVNANLILQYYGKSGGN
jgi:tRNA 2-selenouridine synthase